ncbi:MAG: hypothetical protein ACRCXL_04135, partial [Dermatophilaceae bacterium]
MVTALGRVRATGVAAVLTSLAGLAGLAGCSVGEDSHDGADSGAAKPGPGGGVPVTLEQVRLPAGVAPVAVTSAGDRVLVGGRAPKGS